jgi:hypothetical protein
MESNFFISSVNQKSVTGTANVLIEGLPPFKGVVDSFITDGKSVRVSAKQRIDSKRTGVLSFWFMADITNGEHDYKEDLGLSVMYMFLEEVEDGTIITPYPAVYDSGTVNVTFDYAKGTLAVTFKLDVQNNPTEPLREAHGAFNDVSGLEHVKK